MKFKPGDLVKVNYALLSGYYNKHYLYTLVMDIDQARSYAGIYRVLHCYDYVDYNMIGTFSHLEDAVLYSTFKEDT